MPDLRARVRTWFTEATWQRWVRRGLVAGAAGVVGLVVLVALAYMAVSLPEEPESLQTTIVVDAEGNTLVELFDEENRIDVPLDEVADVMEQATLAAEDRNFYDHSGLDPVGITRALWNDIRGRRLQGGSTITQQLVKNTYLSPERSLVRKLREAVLAVKVEEQLSKDEILERYLNTVYFGRGASGVEQASQIYFGHGASELTLPQAALLAGLIRAPEAADPQTAPEEAARRRESVVRAMVRTGVIDEAAAEEALRSPIETLTKRNPEELLTGSSAFYVAQVRKWAAERFGERVAFGGGLRIETTLDPRLQAEAERAVGGILDRPDDPDAALVTIDDSGAILAMIGGKDFRTSSVNLAVGPEGGNRGRQGGSTFKPVVLAAALENGISVNTRYRSPSRMKVKFEGHPDYEVENYGGQGYGSIDLVQATANSVNTAYAQLAADTGLEEIVETARGLGIRSPLDPFPAMSLGSEEVNPLEMIRAFMAFGTRGVRVDPFYVRRVLDNDGEVIYEATPSGQRVYPEDQADLVNHVLQQVITRGTARSAAIGRPAAGKTGTTTRNTDAWFVGYTPRLGTAVWMGYKEGNSRPMDNVHGREVTGGSFPAQIWQRFMRAAVDGRDTGAFEEPPEELLEQKADPEIGLAPAPTTPATTTPPESTTTTPESSSTTTSPSSTSTSTTATSTTTTTTSPLLGTSTTTTRRDDRRADD